MDQGREFSDLERWAVDHANLLTIQVNESLQIANRSTDRDTKLSRLRVCREKLEELVLLAEQFQFLRLERLDGVRQSIEIVEREAVALPIVIARASAPLLTARANADLVKGLQFQATLQMRTPLSVLKRHGKVHTDLLRDPPAYAREPWQGIWVPALKTWKELGGAAMPEFKSGAASDIGTVRDGDEYCRFLVELKTLASERGVPIAERARRVKEAAGKPGWALYTSAHGGPDAVAGKVFRSM